MIIKEIEAKNTLKSKAKLWRIKGKSMEIKSKYLKKKIAKILKVL